MNESLRKISAPLAASAFALWLGWRLFIKGAVLTLGVTTSEGELPFLFVDWSWLPFALCGALWLRVPPTERAARGYVAVLTFALALHGSLLALTRYYRGDALAWDLANFVQPMWRAMAGEGMISSWHADRPLWGDHGSFGMYLFAPLTRLFDDAGTGPLLAQAWLTAALLPALYALGRALLLPTQLTLLVVVSAFVSRPLSYAATFDFHPECALPLLLTLGVWAHVRCKLWPLLICTLLAATLKDMAALIAANTFMYLAVRYREQRVASLVLALIAFALGVVDTVLLPKLTGWASYVAMNTSAPVDVAIAFKTTAMRLLNGGLLGALHPFGIASGLPWHSAAAISPKLLVKGVQFQYGFLFVPSACLGAAFASSWLSRRTRWGAAIVLAWALLSVAVNAPRTLDLSKTEEAIAQFSARRATLASFAKPGESVATEACTAAYLMERVTLLPLCQIDTERLSAGGSERWDVADPRALSASLILVRVDCALHGTCPQRQVVNAYARGYRIVDQRHGWIALRKDR